MLKACYIKGGTVMERRAQMSVHPFSFKVNHLILKTCVYLNLKSFFLVLPLINLWGLHIWLIMEASAEGIVTQLNLNCCLKGSEKAVYLIIGPVTKPCYAKYSKNWGEGSWIVSPYLLNRISTTAANLNSILNPIIPTQMQTSQTGSSMYI